MGRIDREGNDVVYRQDDGEVTAYLTDCQDRQELAHEGPHSLKVVLCSLLAFGIVYIAVIFFLFR